MMSILVGTKSAGDEEHQLQLPLQKRKARQPFQWSAPWLSSKGMSDSATGYPCVRNIPPQLTFRKRLQPTISFTYIHCILFLMILSILEVRFLKLSYFILYHMHGRAARHLKVICWLAEKVARRFCTYHTFAMIACECFTDCTARTASLVGSYWRRL